VLRRILYARRLPWRNVLTRKIGELDTARAKLAAAEVQLLREAAERERLAGQHRETERGLREVSARFENAFGTAPIGMALIDMEGRWLQVNQALYRITGHTEDSLRRLSLREMTHADDLDIDARDRRRLLSGRISSYQVEKRCRHALGHYVWGLLTVSLVRDEQGEALYFITQLQDISEQRQLAGRLKYLADHDSLTGLYNRRRFEQALAHEAERIARYGTRAAVLLIDLDHFKSVNDSFGHQVGDDVLKRVAASLRQRLRQADVLARIGGDEFAVLLAQTEADRAEVVAADIVKTLRRQTAVLADVSIRITASVGVSMFGGLPPTEVLACADLAMYEAKEAGRNRMAVYRPQEGHRPKTSARFGGVERIRLALGEDRLRLDGQPILDLETGQVSSYELLLRLPDDCQGASLPPHALLYAAQSVDLMRAIDAWVVGKAIGLLADHARAGQRLRLNVNLSSASVRDPNLADLAEEALTESGVDPSLLTFEIAETTVVANLEPVKTLVRRLGSRCRFAVDDFGGGPGSFFMLREVAFDCLKIDGALIRGLQGSVNRLVLQAVCDLARALGTKTVAQLLDDPDAVQLARQIGIDLAQGGAVGPPRPIAEILGAVDSDRRTPCGAVEAR
jgi:diguanylate cyclase (GGDEF)-like protein/PAS domain S-box-containing protein